jgi:hypothetical protein
MTITENIQHLSRFSHRLDGTSNNRDGAEFIKESFEKQGWTTNQQYFSVPGTLALGIALNLLPLLFIYFTFRQHYTLSLILTAIVLVSLWGELTFTFHFLRNLLPRHQSANIEASLDSAQPDLPTVIVSAHHDTPQTGFLYETLAEGMAPSLRKLPPPFNRMFFPLLAGGMLLGVGMAVIPSAPWLLTVKQISLWTSIPILIIASLLILQWAFSTPSPGANDNSSGVLVLLELARRFSQNPPQHANIKLLATGAEEAGFFGIKAFLRVFKKKPLPLPYFINVDSVGGGTLFWGTAEECLTKVDYPAAGLKILEELEAAGNIPKLDKICIIAPTDSSQIAKNKYPALTLIGLKDNAIPPNYHKRSDTFDKLQIQNIEAVSDAIESYIRNFPKPTR